MVHCSFYLIQILLHCCPTFKYLLTCHHYQHLKCLWNNLFFVYIYLKFKSKIMIVKSQIPIKRKMKWKFKIYFVRNYKFSYTFTLNKIVVVIFRGIRDRRQDPNFRLKLIILAQIWEWPQTTNPSIVSWGQWVWNHQNCDINCNVLSIKSKHHSCNKKCRQNYS